MNFTIINTKTVPTVQVEKDGKKIFFHSKYNPLKEAEIWCENELKYIDKEKDIIVIGLSAGYHVQTLAKALPNTKITVIEFNEDYFNWFMKSIFFNNLSRFRNVKVRSFNNSLSIDKISSLLSTLQLLIHRNGLDLIPTKYDKLNNILEEILLRKKSIESQIENMKNNYIKNIRLNDKGISVLKYNYIGKPMILVSAGPSLDKQLPFIKQISYNSNFIIGAVATAIKPLLSNRIIPDFFMLSDPNPETIHQLTNLESSLDETPLFYLSTANHDTILLHSGPRYIVWQDGYKQAEEMASIKNDPTIKTGGSVATSLLDLMVKLGGNIIALVGQDLAYTNGKSHAQFAISNLEYQLTSGLLNVENYHQTGVVNTAKNLTIYRKWFENYYSRNSHLMLFNCTEGGAYINNFKHISLFEFYSRYK